MTFCGTPNKYFHAEVWKVSLENMEDKILGFQFEPVSTKWTRPSYNDGSDQDEPETHHNRLSSQEWCNCQKCKKMPTGLECVCCHEIPEVKAFHLKGKARLSWNTAALEFTEVVVCRCFPKCVFLKISLYPLENTCVGVAFIKIFFWGGHFFLTLSKRDPSAGVFLWILQNF